MKMEALPEICV